MQRCSSGSGDIGLDGWARMSRLFGWLFDLNTYDL
jgi:hypothetical protein